MEQNTVRLNDCKRPRAVVLICFVLMFAAGLLVSGDYGVPTDQWTELHILFDNTREYVSLFFNADSEIMYRFDESGIGYISSSIERDHGQAGYYPLALILILATHLFGNLANWDISYIYHCYTFVLSFTAVIAVYILAKDIFGSRKTALLGAAMLFISPRFFAESHYNNKDIILLCLAIDMCCFGILSIKYRKPCHVILFSLFSALTCNTKIVGLFFFGVLGISYVIYVFVIYKWNVAEGVIKGEAGAWYKTNIVVMCSAIIMFLVFYYTLTPSMWRDPIDFFDHSLFNAFNFSRWDGYALFDGQLYRPANHELPIRYLPQLMLITSPVFVVILSAVGIGRFIAAAAGRDRGNWQKLFFTAVICIYSLLPMVVGSLTRAIVYNGWRHFYFSYFGLLFLAIYGLDWLTRRYGRLATICLNAAMGISLIITIANHPYQNTFFNFMAGSDVEAKYETDYWGLSSMDALRLVLSDAPEDGLAHVTWTNDTSRLLLINAYNTLPDEESDRLWLENDISKAEYIVSDNSSINKYGSIDIPNDFVQIDSISAYGNELCAIFKRVKD